MRLCRPSRRILREPRRTRSSTICHGNSAWRSEALESCRHPWLARINGAACDFRMRYGSRLGRAPVELGTAGGARAVASGIVVVWIFQISPIGRNRRDRNVTWRNLRDNPMHHPILAMNRAPRCGARLRSGKPCQSPVVRGKRRCRMPYRAALDSSRLRADEALGARHLSWSAPQAHRCEASPSKVSNETCR